MTSEQPIKILMTTDAVGGVWTYSLGLARALEPHNVHFILATMGPAPDPQQLRAAAALPNLTLCPSTWKLEWMPDPWDDVRAAGRWLLDLEEQFQPDLIHLNGYAHGALPWRAPRLIVGHSCVLSWWRAVKGQDAPPEWNRYRAHVRAGIAAADLVVAPSYAMLRALDDHNAPLPRAEVIYNARDGALFLPRRKRPFVLSAGRLWDQAKNLATLERIAPDLSWSVYVAGDEQGSGSATAHVRHTRSLGRLTPDSLAKWLARASIYCLPARYEPFGLSVLEAALCGCALVLGDIPSLREIWHDAALFIPPDDPAGLCVILTDLINDSARRAELARRAVEQAARYTPRRMADAYLSAYRQLVSSGFAVESL